MKTMKWWLAAVSVWMAAGAQADWYIVYSPVLAKHTGRSTYCCFPTKPACEEARARYLHPGDSVGCQGFDSPAVKAQKGAKVNSAEQQRAKQEAAQKAKAEQQRREEEARFRKDKAETLGSLKGLDGSSSGGGDLTLKAAPATTALDQLKNDDAWSDSAAKSRSDEQARDHAERGAQGLGGIKHKPAPGIPDVPPPTRVQGQ